MGLNDVDCQEDQETGQLVVKEADIDPENSSQNVAEDLEIFEEYMEMTEGEEEEHFETETAATPVVEPYLETPVRQVDTAQA